MKKHLHVTTHAHQRFSRYVCVLGEDLRRVLAKFRYQIFDLLRRISFNRQEVQSYPFKTETKGKFLMLPLLYVKSIFGLFSQFSTLGIVHA